MTEINEEEVFVEREVLELKWMHNGMKMACKLGGRLPKYYGTDDEPVLSIIEDDRCFVIRTRSRGGESGPPVFAGKTDKLSVKYV